METTIKQKKKSVKRIKSLSVVPKGKNLIEHRSIAVDFLHRVAKGDVKEAFKLYTGKSFVHHNPYFKSDADTLMKAMGDNAKENPHKSLDVVHVLEDGDLVAVHSLIKQNPQDRGGVVVHIFRFKRMRIVELWDVGMEIPENLVNEAGII